MKAHNPLPTGIFDAQELARLEYEAVQTEKRERIGARLTIWTIFLTLVGAFGLASFQNNMISYLVLLSPPIITCLARYTGHNEAILDQLKAYLFQVESKRGYQGYEHFNKSSRRKSFGAHAQALCMAFLLTQALAIAAGCWRLWSDQIGLLHILVVLVVGGVSLALTVRWLRPS